MPSRGSLQSVTLKSRAVQVTAQILRPDSPFSEMNNVVAILPHIDSILYRGLQLPQLGRKGVSMVGLSTVSDIALATEELYHYHDCGEENGTCAWSRGMWIWIFATRTLCDVMGTGNVSLHKVAIVTMG